MQITLHTEELNANQLGHLEAIIRVKKEQQLYYENHSVPCKNSEGLNPLGAVLNDAANQKPYEPVEEQPTEPIEEQPSEPVKEKPKRTRRTKAEIEAENAQKDEEASEVVEEEIVASIPVSLTLSDIKTKAQELVTKVSRDAVKNTINKYADKISEVKESDYAALTADFEALEG